MVVEDYGEADSKLVKVSILEGGDIFVVGTIPVGKSVGSVSRFEELE